MERKAALGFGFRPGSRISAHQGQTLAQYPHAIPLNPRPLLDAQTLRSASLPPAVDIWAVSVVVVVIKVLRTFLRM